MKDLEDALKEAGFGDAEPHFKRLTYYLDKCKDTSDFEYHWSELKNTVEKPAVQTFQVIGDQAVVDFIEKNPDYFDDFKEVVIEPPRKKQRGRPARFKSGQDTKTDPALELANELLKNERQKEAVFSNERGTLNKPYLIAVTRGKRDRLPQFYVNIDGLIRAIRVDHINLSGAFMAKCCGFMGPSKCKARHKIQITNKNLYHMIEAGDAGRERCALKENASQLFDRSSYEMVPHDSITGVSNLSPLCEHTCDEVRIEEVIAMLKKKGHIDENETLASLTKNDNSRITALDETSDTDSMMEIDDFCDEPRRESSNKDNLVVEGVLSNKRGTLNLPHLVAVSKGKKGRLPKFFLNIDGDIRSVRPDKMNSTGEFMTICSAANGPIKCKSRHKIKINDKSLFDIVKCEGSDRERTAIKEDAPRLYDRSSYDIIPYDSIIGVSKATLCEHTCEKIHIEEVIALLRRNGQLDESVADDRNPLSKSALSNKISNERGSLNLPHLVAVVKGKQWPKFYVNIDGNIRAVRPQEIKSSGMMIIICSVKKCKGRHRFQVVDKSTIRAAKRKGSRDRYVFNGDAQNLFDRSSYEVIYHDSGQEHTCEKSSIEDIIAALMMVNQDENETLNSLKERTDSASEISSDPESMDHEENIPVQRQRNQSKEDDLVVEGVGQVSLPHLIAVAPGKIVQTRPKFYVNICNKFFEMHQETLNLDGGVTLVCKKRDCSAKSKLRILDENMIAKEPGKRAPAFVEGCPNVFNRNFFGVLV